MQSTQRLGQQLQPWGFGSGSPTTLVAATLKGGQQPAAHEVRGAVAELDRPHATRTERALASELRRLFLQPAPKPINLDDYE